MTCEICNDTGTDYLGRPCRIHGLGAVNDPLEGDPMPTVAIDANGYWWRVWGEDPCWSMVPTNSDNEPIPHPCKFYRLVEIEGGS